MRVSVIVIALAVFGAARAACGEDLVLDSGFVTVDDERIYYETLGDGPPVVLCHGLGGNHAIWYQQAPAFAQAAYLADSLLSRPLTATLTYQPVKTRLPASFFTGR